MFISQALAQTADLVPAAVPTTQSTLMQFAPLFAIFAVFWFLLIRPQQKKMKELQTALSALRRGDKVVTAGGILGTITKVEDGDMLTVEIADNVKVRVLRSTISSVQSKGEPVVADAVANDEKK
jgi:preprotein translocase subunit YajC